MIIGTAGHIDHGKTTLIKALTGIETDRLAEEKKRGITIELGYAYTPLPNGEVLGFVDAPGHEKLVHTMVAGASGIDFGLLIIAADDGVMPQTREHLAVLKLLGLQRGAVVISKADRASAARILQVQKEIQQLVQGSFLEQGQLFCVDALSPQSTEIKHLREYLYQQAQLLQQQRSDGYFRLAIDRAFSLQGHGTVITGSIHSGTVSIDSSQLAIMPAAHPVRIRSIHAQNTPTEQAHSGQRCALNIAGPSLEQIQRGDWLADVRCFTPSERIDVALSLLPQADAPLKAWSPWHVHLGAAHYLAHAVPLQPDPLAPGERGLVQLVFDVPVCSVPGDRFILRNAQARETVGGGQVLDPQAPDRKRRAPARIARLQAVQNWLGGEGLQALLPHAPYGWDEHELQRLYAGRPLPDLPEQAIWLASDQHAARRLISHAHLENHEQQIQLTLARFHEHYPDEPGINASRLRRMASPAMPEALWHALITRLLQKDLLQRKGNWLYQPGHTITLNADDQNLGNRILPLSLAGAYDPPWVRDIARNLDEEEARVRQVMRSLVRRGDLYQVVHDLYYHKQSIAQLAALIAQLATQHGLSAAQFRDATQLGRKRAIQVLEFFNRVGYTRRIRDRHVLRGESWQHHDTV